MTKTLDNLQSLLNSEELQEYLTDYCNCDKVSLLLNYEGHDVYTLNVAVIVKIDDTETVAYSETYEFMFTRQGRITSLLHRKSPYHEYGRTLHALTLGNELTKYLNDRLPNESGLSECDLKNLDRRTLYPKTMIRKYCNDLID